MQYRRLVKSLLIIEISLLLNSFAVGQENEPYVSTNGSEATMEFVGAIKYKFKTSTPEPETIEKAIESQLMYLVGPMSTAPSPSVPKEDYTLTEIKVLSRDANTLTITYRYKGAAIIGLGPVDSYNIVLPFDPTTIYDRSMDGAINPCTDPVYYLKASFWYFWSPYRSGCKLLEDDDFYVIKAKIKRIENTKISYPEYQNLRDEKGNVTIHMFFGMNRGEEDRDPLVSKDINAINYRDFRSSLLNKGYAATRWNNDQIRKIARTQNDASPPYVETIQRGKIIYRMFFGTTGTAENSLAFQWFYKAAIENASVMFYSGHSGLGRRLVIDTIEKSLGEKIKFNLNKYQIFFFNGCTSYRYYSDMYLKRKKTASDPKGSKKLDIFSNGLFTYFNNMNRSNLAFAMAVEKALDAGAGSKEFISYQQIARDSDSGNLFSISGDEDNELPTH